MWRISGMPAPQLPDNSDLRVIGMQWEEFLDYMAKEWKPGQHIALVGKTGANKTTFAIPLLQQRSYALAFDPKGGDSTLSTLHWPRLTTWPMSRKQLDRIGEGFPARYIVGKKIDRADERPAMVKLFRDVLTGAFDMGGFT